MLECEICHRSFKNSQALGAHKVWIHGIAGRKYKTRKPGNALVNDHKVVLDLVQQLSEIDKKLIYRIDLNGKSINKNFERIQTVAGWATELKSRLNDVDNRINEIQGQVNESIALINEFKIWVKDVIEPIMTARSIVHGDKRQ